MTGAPYQRPTLPPPPPDPYDEVRTLIEGDLCDAGRGTRDHRGCPQIAFVRVYMYQPGTKELLGEPLHWCAHHWVEVADRMVALALEGRCSIRDERQWLARWSR